MGFLDQNMDPKSEECSDHEHCLFKLHGKTTKKTEIPSSLRIQSPSQMVIRVYNHLFRQVFRFHLPFSEGDWIPRGLGCCMIRLKAGQKIIQTHVFLDKS